MSKYIDADLLIRKIRGQIRLENLNFAALGGGGQTFCTNTLEWVLKQISSLQQEQPDKSLEEAADEHYDEMWDELGGFAETRDGCYDIFFPSKAIRDTFIAGAEWQASQMPMPEDTVLFNKGVAEGRRLEREDMLKDAEECELYWVGNFLAIDLNMAALGYSEKDKVKVIVLKAEEE